MKRVHEYYELAEGLRGACLRSIKPETIAARARDFLEGYTGVTTMLSQNIMVRARKCEDPGGFDNIKEVLYPPAAKTGYGRAQSPGVSVLYAGQRATCAVDEIHVQRGDRVHVAYVRPKEDRAVACHVVGALQTFWGTAKAHRLIPDKEMAPYIWSLCDPDPERYISSVLIDSFVNSVFRKASFAPHEYKVSAELSPLLTPVNGVLAYPSVQNDGGINFAIPPAVFDAYFEVVHTSVLEVKESLGFGIYQFEQVRSCCDIADDGTINWKSARRREYMKYHEPEDIDAKVDLQPGWRKPT